MRGLFIKMKCTAFTQVRDLKSGKTKLQGKKIRVQIFLRFQNLFFIYKYIIKEIIIPPFILH